MWTGRRLWAALIVAIGVCGCGGHGRTSTRTAGAASTPRLAGAQPCPGVPGFRCSTLSVPLDHGGASARLLRLRVGVQVTSSAPRGVLVFLTGGPGQSGVPFIPHIRLHLGSLLDGYRLVMLDQRGTGNAALRCPALQAAAGSSDLVVPPPGVVGRCAAAIGPDRRYYTTAETVGDLDALRAALGVGRLTVDGVSYGSFVAERYALTYPHNVARLVLDSVVPQQGVDALSSASITATARVLRSVCAAARCGFDPARDLATIVDAHHDGPALLDALVAESVVAPAFPHVLGALHAGARGDMGAIDAFLAAVRAGEAAPAAALSQGLHDSTLCLELASPWDPRAPARARAASLVHDAARVPPSAWFPYDRATAAGNGLGVSCAQWPPTTPPAFADGDAAHRLPPVPILLLAGERDLSTPLVWAEQESREAPGGRVLLVPGAGHSVQTKSARNPVVRQTLARFLAG